MSMITRRQIWSNELPSPALSNLTSLTYGAAACSAVAFFASGGLSLLLGVGSLGQVESAFSEVMNLSLRDMASTYSYLSAASAFASCALMFLLMIVQWQAPTRNHWSYPTWFPIGALLALVGISVGWAFASGLL